MTLSALIALLEESKDAHFRCGTVQRRAKGKPHA
jgi:hypothetical protein